MSWITRLCVTSKYIIIRQYNLNVKEFKISLRLNFIYRIGWETISLISNFPQDVFLFPSTFLVLHFDILYFSRDEKGCLFEGKFNSSWKNMLQLLSLVLIWIIYKFISKPLDEMKEQQCSFHQIHQENNPVIIRQPV